MANYKYHSFLKSAGPREKLLNEGVDYLSNVELLAIILTVGTRKANVLEMAGSVIREYGFNTLPNLRDFRKLSEYAGIPLYKAMQVIAMLELGRRIYKESSDRKQLLNSPEKVYKVYSSLGKKQREELHVLYLNSRQFLLGEELVSLGTVNAVEARVREVVAPALELNSAGIILLHNHPSGSASPSDADIAYTKEVAKACALLNIQLLDHLIIAEKSYFSFVEGGLL